LAGLEAVPQNTEFVFIHDGARPLIQTDAILRLFKAVQTDKAAVLAHPLNDTIKRIPTAGQLKTQPLEDLERDRLWAMETPQAFAFPQILQAYTQVREAGLTVTDDTAAAAHIGLHATLVHNTSPNPKITTPEDLAFLQWYLDQA
jgi:2-C-methyl-D-erythritol 4-phosphate cytidylyltransferase